MRPIPELYLNDKTCRRKLSAQTSSTRRYKKPDADSWHPFWFGLSRRLKGPQTAWLQISNSGGSISTTSTLTSSLHSETQELQLEKTPFELIIPNQELTSWHASHHRITYTCNYVREWGLTAGVTGDHLAMRSWGQAPDSDFYFHGARSLGPHPSSDSAFSATHLYGFVTRRQNLSTDRNLNYSKLLPMVVFFYGDSHIDLQKI